MSKKYTLDDHEACLEELKSMRGLPELMMGRLERDEISPDEWRQWHTGYRNRLDELRKAISEMRDELSRRNADLERQKQEHAAELSMAFEGNKNSVK